MHECSYSHVANHLIVQASRCPHERFRGKNLAQNFVPMPKSTKGSTGLDIDIEEDDVGGNADPTAAKVSVDDESSTKPSQEPIDPWVHKLIRDWNDVSNKESKTIGKEITSCMLITQGLRFGSRPLP